MLKTESCWIFDRAPYFYLQFCFFKVLNFSCLIKWTIHFWKTHFLYDFYYWELIWVIDLFHATGLFLYPLETSENQRFFDVYRRCRKRQVKTTNRYSKEKTRWNVKIKRLCPPKSTLLDPRFTWIYNTGRVNSTKVGSRQTGTFCNYVLIIKLNDLDIPNTEFTKENRCSINFVITF